MKKKILLVVGILFGLMFINAGLNKFLNYIPVPDDLPETMVKLMGAMMEIGWLMPLVALVEIAGGILFMIPMTRALGAIVIFPVMIGIVLTHIINAPSGLVMALVLLVINLWVIYENREKYLPMVR
jgi:putative oxidoreductase